MNQEYVAIESVAEKFSVSISTVRSWVRKGFIPRDSYIKAGNTYRFKIAEIENSLRRDKDEHWSETLVEDEGIEMNLDDDV
tara:strand:+ start:6850 stop:7092 length:243 start_codon:yes stop_codon:yes gene_type:complete